MDESILLDIQHLSKTFPIKGAKGQGVQAVVDVSLQIRQGETLGLVGESGCGKTTLGRTILQLYPPTSGRICYRGRPLFEPTGGACKSFFRIRPPPWTHA